MKGRFNAWLVKKMQPTKIFLVALNHRFSKNNIQIKNHPLQPWARQMMRCRRENLGDGYIKKKQKGGQTRNKKYCGFVISAWIAVCANDHLLNAHSCQCAPQMSPQMDLQIFTWSPLWEHKLGAVRKFFSKLRWKEETCIHQQNKNIWVLFFFLTCLKLSLNDLEKRKYFSFLLYNYLQLLKNISCKLFLKFLKS